MSCCFIDSKSYVEWGALWQKLWFLSMMPYFKLLVHDHGICQQVHNHQGHYLHYELKYNEIAIRFFEINNETTALQFFFKENITFHSTTYFDIDLTDFILYFVCLNA